MSDQTESHRRLKTALALFVAVPVSVMPMASAAQDKTSVRRTVRRVRERISGFRVLNSAPTKIRTRDAARGMATGIRVLTTGLRARSKGK